MKLRSSQVTWGRIVKGRLWCTNNVNTGLVYELLKKQNVQIVSTKALKTEVILCNGHGAAVWHFL